MAGCRDRYRDRVEPPARLGATALLLDVAVAVALVSLGQAEVWGADPDRKAVALAVISTAPLAARRLAPVPVLLVSLACLSVLTINREDSFTVAQLLALMLATYTVAGSRGVRTAAVCLAFVLAAALTNSAMAPGTSGGDFVFPVVLLGVPWAAGAALREWRIRAARLQELADELRAERATHARLAIAAERGRIARDLHDSLAQSLNAVVVHAEAAEEALHQDSRRVEISLARIQEIGRSSLAETRQLLTALRADDDGAEDQPRVDQLDDLVDAFRRGGLGVSLSQQGTPSGLTASVEAAVYRIVQESLTNVVRHACAREAQVRICYGSDVEVEVRDDGSGSISGIGAGGGLGTLGMRERVQLLGGTLTSGPATPGWSVRARIPVEVTA